MVLNHGKKNYIYGERIMDLKKLDSISASEEGKWVDILDGDGNKTGIRIKCKGIDSKAFKSQSTAIRKYVQKQKEKGASEDQDVMDEKSYIMLASCTLDWEEIEEDGAEIKFSLENAKYLYSSYPVIANQVASFVMDRSRFLEI